MAISSEALIIISNIPFIIPNAQMCVQETSRSTADFDRLDQLSKGLANLRGVNTSKSNFSVGTSYYSIIDKSLNVQIELTSSNDFFNKYNTFKVAVENLMYWDQAYPEKRYINYVSYWGLKDYMEYGQFTSCTFQSQSSTNRFTVELDLQSFQPPLKAEQSWKVVSSEGITGG